MDDVRNQCARDLAVDVLQQTPKRMYTTRLTCLLEPWGVGVSAFAGSCWNMHLMTKAALKKLVLFVWARDPQFGPMPRHDALMRVDRMHVGILFLRLVLADFVGFQGYRERIDFSTWRPGFAPLSMPQLRANPGLGDMHLAHRYG